MAADGAAHDARVAKLERPIRNVLPYKIDAFAHGPSLVHDDIRAVRATVEGNDAEFDAIDQWFPSRPVAV
jgi:hypothetical protein